MSIWIPPQLAEMREHSRSLTWQEVQVFYLGEYPYGCSISGLWAWRGYIAKKLLGRMPTTDDVDLPADHAFFDIDYIDTTQTQYADGTSGPVEYWRRGRRLKETSSAVRRYRERLSRS